jgi:type VI secretion system protein ImpB
MAQEGSVAPKERVNIVYKPATGGAQAEIELPLKLMVLGDFTQRGDSTPLEERKPVRVDKDNFNDVMRQQNLGLDVNVPNRLVDQPDGQMGVHLKFDALKSFEPGEIAKQVPELANLVELREALQSLRGPLGNDRAFVQKITSLLKDPAQVAKLLSELGVQDEGAGPA